MKILQLGKFYPIRGGVEKVMWDMTVGLAGRGVTCDMLCAMIPGDKVEPRHAGLVQETKEGKVIRVGRTGRVICVPAIAKVAATMLSLPMLRWVRRHCDEYDIIHIHHPDPMAAVSLLLSGYKGRVILHWHSDIVSQKFLLMFYKPIQSWLVRRAERIIGTTPVYIKDSEALKNVQDKTICVPIGIAPVVYNVWKRDEIRDHYYGKKIIYGLGRLVPYKGFSHLVMAAKHLPDDYIILIGGKGPLRETLENLIKEEHLEGKVEMIGFVENWEVANYYAACDLFVVSSMMKTEAFGIVQIEAMSCGKPVVAPLIANSGVSWVNDHGVSGLNVKAKDEKALADAILDICSDHNRYLQFAAGAFSRYERYFTLDRMIDKVLDIYEKKA